MRRPGPTALSVAVLLGLLTAGFLASAAPGSGSEDIAQADRDTRTQADRDTRTRADRDTQTQAMQDPYMRDVTPRMEKAVSDALKYIDAKAHETHEANGFSARQYPVASTSLGVLALMAGGNAYGRGEYGAAVAKGLRYLIKVTQPNGFVGLDESADGRMHSQGFAVLAIAEAYGMVPRAEQANVQRALTQAVRLIVRSQTREGGWGYHHAGDPNAAAGWDEASVTITMVQALRAARNAGVQVDASVIHRAQDYVRRCAKPDGSFRYSLAQNYDRSSYELTSAAVSTLNATGVYASEELHRGMDFMKRAWQDNPWKACSNFEYYGNFYAAQAVYQAGPDVWQVWFPPVRDYLIRTQRPEGNWESQRGDLYATAICALILQIPYKYLPIFQR